MSVQLVAISEHDEHAGYIYRSRFYLGLGLDSKLLSRMMTMSTTLRVWIVSCDSGLR